MKPFLEIQDAVLTDARQKESSIVKLLEAFFEACKRYNERGKPFPENIRPFVRVFRDERPTAADQAMYKTVVAYIESWSSREAGR